MDRLDGKPVLAESAYGVMELRLALAFVVPRPDEDNRRREKKREQRGDVQENPTESCFFVGGDPPNRCDDTAMGTFRVRDAGLG